MLAAACISSDQVLRGGVQEQAREPRNLLLKTMVDYIMFLYEAGRSHEEGNKSLNHELSQQHDLTC